MRRGQGRGDRPPFARVCVVAVLVCASLLSARSASAQSLPEEYRFATGLYKQQRWDVAADAFRAFLKKFPDHERVPYARLYLGLTLVNADRYADARAVLRDYVRDYPRSKSVPDAMYRVAECSYLLDDLRSAESEFARFLNQYPRHELVEWALPYLADTELRLKKPEAARRSFEQAIAQFPKSRLTSDSKYGLARAFEELKQDDRAITLYGELAADKESPRAAQSLMNMATLQFRGGHFEIASKSFLRLAGEFPKSLLVSSAHLNAGFCFYRMERYPQALTEFGQAAADKRHAAEANYWKGITLKAQGDLAKAADVLAELYRSDPKGELAQNSLFYEADCDLRLGRYDAAKKQFLELVDRWPAGEFSDDSLHFAAEAALAKGDVGEADALVRRFEREYARSPLKLHEEILAARVESAKADAVARSSKAKGDAALTKKIESLRADAIRRLEGVLRESHLPRTLTLARYHLGRTLEESGDYARAVEVLAPLLEEAEKPQPSTEAVESLALSGHSSHELGKHDAAVAALTKYLSLQPRGKQAAQALSDRALSLASLGRRDQAAHDAEQLRKQFPGNQVGVETLRRLAELSYDAKDWKGAAGFFASLAHAGPAGSDVERMGLSGLGWATFNAKERIESAAAFGKVFDSFSPRIDQVAEAGYMRGRALQEAGKLSEAAQAYAAAFAKLVPATPVAAGEELHPPLEYPFLAGVQGANLFAQLKQFDSSDALYSRVVKSFPKSEKLGQVLFDWANVIYLAKATPENRARARTLLARVASEFPQSAANRKARLFAAELDLLDGKTASAEEDLRKLLPDLDHEPKLRAEALARLTELAAERSDWSAVNDSAGKFLADFPNEPDAAAERLHLGAAQLGLKDFAAAEKTLAALKQEIASKSKWPDWSGRVWVLLAEAFYQQKKYPQVESTVEELRRLSPKSSVLYQADEVLGRSYKNQANWAKAIAAFQRVIDDRQAEQNPTAAKSQLMIGEIHFLQKDFHQAREDYLKVYTLYDSLPEWAAPALYQAGQCEEQLNHSPEAEKTYAQVIATFPKTDYARSAKSRLEELRKRPSG